MSLHEVARRVGLRQPSLYAYIDSKAALYDAMFGQAAQALLDHEVLDLFGRPAASCVTDVWRFGTSQMIIG